jgi:cytochrome b subunit of formate dehydrogenase
MQETTDTPSRPAAPAPTTAPAASGKGRQALYRRFGRAERIGHIGLGISFIGLAITGLPLLYSQEPWARWIAHSIGGFEATGFLHRFFAMVMILLFIWHLGRVFRRIIVDRDLGMLWGPYSMVPQPRDARDVYQNIRYFLGKGEPPRFERYTYWEKFDYWAVFWGMAIIGGSGLILWFPEFFTRFLPGWTLNLASVIHGLEAVLAVGFIFTIHLFHNNLRAEKFPMDTVMFTGYVTEEELRTERAEEYERLQREGKLKELETEPARPSLVAAGRAYGVVVNALGLILVGLMLYALFG